MSLIICLPRRSEIVVHVRSARITRALLEPRKRHSLGGCAPYVVAYQSVGAFLGRGGLTDGNAAISESKLIFQVEREAMEAVEQVQHNGRST